MICPKCGVALERHDMGHLVVDECPHCAGIWLHAGELEAAIDEFKRDVAWMELELWQQEDLFSVQPSERMSCPTCLHTLATVNPPGSSIQIEICPVCRGIWLDRGEFQKILQEMEAELTRKSAGELALAAVQEGLEVVVGKKGIAREWRELSTITRLLQYRLLAENPGLQKALLALAGSSPFK